MDGGATNWMAVSTYLCMYSTGGSIFLDALAEYANEYWREENGRAVLGITFD